MITDFETWMLDVGFDRTFRILEYRRIGDWTPLEMDKKYIDQSQYKDISCQFIRIKEAITLPDGDILLGYIDVTDSDWDKNVEEDDHVIYYRKLSQLEIDWDPVYDRENDDE